MAAILWFKATVVLWFLPLALGIGARLYTEEDPLVILGSSSLKLAVRNSSSAWLVQFYSSWCGHCIQYSSTWKALAQDVKDWDQAIGVAVLDCAQEENFEVCKEYGIHYYPTFRYFRAHSRPADQGTTYRGADREIQTVRQLIVNFLQNHTKLDWPDNCPPLEAYSSVELLPLLGQRSDQYMAIIIEEPDSYVGREVILDLLQYSGLVVRRALATDLPLVDRLGITAFPSAYLLHPNGTHTHLHVQKRLRFFFSSLLRLLPGVHRRPRLDSSRSSLSQTGAQTGRQSTEPWRDFNSSKVYMADLESALHYLLRVELATHNILEGEELKTFKDFVTVVAKLYPGGGSVVKLMETLLEWLLSLPLDRIPYQAVLDLVDNKMRISGVFLGAELRWVGCQGSRAGLRGYPCSLWTLFHVLTVQHDATPTALDNTALEGEPAAVLQVMHRYIRTFFGCRQCGQHFDQAAASLDRVQTTEQQILWLWRQHNLVNNRLAGSLSEDPLFPKAPWPSPALCASCHEEKEGVHVWNQENVLNFLRKHYTAANLSPKYSLTLQHLPAPPPQPSQPLEGKQGGGGGEGGGGGGERAGGEKEPKKKAEKHPDPHHQGLREEVREEVEEVPGGGGVARGGVWILGLGFNSVDMSLCVVLYVCSCLFLMLLFFFFKVRSKRWKLRHNRPYV